jgi:PAS domain-containing protein
MYGTSLRDATGSISDLDARVHPDDLPRVRAVLAAAIEDAGAVDVEFRSLWPDGTVRWLHARAAPPSTRPAGPPR